MMQTPDMKVKVLEDLIEMLEGLSPMEGEMSMGEEMPMEAESESVHAEPESKSIELLKVEGMEDPDLDKKRMLGM